MILALVLFLSLNNFIHVVTSLLSYCSLVVAIVAVVPGGVRGVQHVCGMVLLTISGTEVKYGESQLQSMVSSASLLTIFEHTSFSL